MKVKFHDILRLGFILAQLGTRFQSAAGKLYVSAKIGIAYRSILSNAETAH